MSTWLTPPQVAERTGFSVSTLANWRSLSTGPAWIKVGTRIRYDEAVVSAWMEQAA
jgi:predicted DNA-binding transcriptional regulator AlpA